MSIVAGKTGWWKNAGTAYPMREWNLRLSNNRIDITNFTSSGFSESLSGFTSGTMRASGFLDAAITQLTPGQSITASLGIGGGYSVSFSGVLTDINVSNTVDNAARIEIEAATNGVFTTTFAAS